MALEHGRRVGEHDRDGVAASDATLGKCRGETPGTGIKVLIAALQGIVD
jgi:hypothetical protein